MEDLTIGSKKQKMTVENGLLSCHISVLDYYPDIQEQLQTCEINLKTMNVNKDSALTGDVSIEKPCETICLNMTQIFECVNPQDELFNIEAVLIISPSDTGLTIKPESCKCLEGTKKFNLRLENNDPLADVSEIMLHLYEIP